MIAAGRIALLALACLSLACLGIVRRRAARREHRRATPPIVSKPISFPAKRKAEMQAYAEAPLRPRRRGSCATRR
jgi:hypothetical protein